MSSVNMSQFESNPNYHIAIVVIQDQPYLEGALLVNRQSGRYYVVITGVGGEILGVVKHGQL